MDVEPNMVAAMPLSSEGLQDKKTMTMNDLRNLALVLAGGLALLLVSGQLADSDSSSVGTEVPEKLGETYSPNYVTIGITTVAGNNIVTYDDTADGFSVIGTSTGADTGTSVSVVYLQGGNSATANCVTAANGAWDCDFDNDGVGDSNGDGTSNTDMSGVSDGTITVTASFTVDTVSYSATSFITQDTSVPTVSIATSPADTPATGGTTATDAITLTFTLGESSSNFALEDIATGGAGDCTLSSFSGSGQSYSVVCTADGQGSITIDVPADSFTDANGNGNDAATQYTWTYDSVDPTITENTPVSTPGNDATPDVVVTSDEDVTLSWGTCTSGQTIDSATTTLSAGIGATITLDSDGAASSLSEGTYTGCELTGTDDAGNSATITLSTFTIDTTLQLLQSQ